MNEPHSAQSGPAPAALATAPPAYDPRRPPPPRTSGERRVMAVIGGMLAGLGIGVGLALLMHIIEETQPQNFNGIGGSVAAALLLVGPLFGLGVGIALSSLIPDAGAAAPGGQPPPPPPRSTQPRPDGAVTDA